MTMLIKGCNVEPIVQYAVVEMSGLVVETYDDFAEAEYFARAGDQIVELTGHGYVGEITDGTEEDVFTTDEQPSPFTVADIEEGEQTSGAPDAQSFSDWYFSRNR